MASRKLRRDARHWVQHRFSKEEFNRGFIEQLDLCLHPAK